MSTMNRNKNRAFQTGVFLIEALVAILIFAVGILGMVAMAGTAIGAQSDARFRTDAAALADSLASDIVLNVVRTDLAAFTASLATFAHHPGGVDCVFNGPAAAGNPIVDAWLARVGTAGPGLPGLPGATAATQQVVVDAAPGGFGRVQITICWQAASDPVMRHHTFVTYVNGLV